MRKRQGGQRKRQRGSEKDRKDVKEDNKIRLVYIKVHCEGLCDHIKYTSYVCARCRV